MAAQPVCTCVMYVYMCMCNCVCLPARAATMPPTPRMPACGQGRVLAAGMAAHLLAWFAASPAALNRTGADGCPAAMHAMHARTHAC